MYRVLCRRSLGRTGGSVVLAPHAPTLLVGGHRRRLSSTPPATRPAAAVTSPPASDDLAQRVLKGGSSVLNSFFTETSRRALKRQTRRKRSERRRHARQRQPATTTLDPPTVDTRSVADLLWPSPHAAKHRLAPEDLAARRTWRFYLQASQQTWELYRASWGGFWSSGMIIQDPSDPRLHGGPIVSPPGGTKDDVDSSSSSSSSKTTDLAVTGPTTGKLQGEESTSPANAAEHVRRNVRRNSKLLRKGALSLRNQVRDQTGIRTKEDVRRFVTEIMTLVSESLEEFLGGYREGRNLQVKRMVEDDLRQQQAEQAKTAARQVKEENKPRPRRKIKRRVLRR